MILPSCILALCCSVLFGHPGQLGLNLGVKWPVLETLSHGELEEPGFDQFKDERDAANPRWVLPGPQAAVGAPTDQLWPCAA